jgi:pyruvate/2-oxoglutarate dehydrogenase complex dihydrolipoamide acyltransferase (E2) component
VRWLVREGDSVTALQPIAAILFDEATVDVPATSAGRVARLCVKQGADVIIGAPLIELT